MPAERLGAVAAASEAFGHDLPSVKELDIPVPMVTAQ
jgi:hypothetical protein